MAFVVEDGTGLETANAYVSVDDADSYFTDKGVSSWTGADAVKQAAITRASFALDGIYGGRWVGYRSTQDQGLDWPRTQAWDKDGFPQTGVPTALEKATCEAALLELGSEGILTPALSRGGLVASESVGPVAISYFGNAPAGVDYQTVKYYVSRLIKGTGGITVSRG